VLAGIGPSVARIYVVDDACPEGSADVVERDCADPRVRVIRHADNQGVGGAVISGYRAALADAMDVVVKIDGDGQMDPGLIPDFVAPVLAGESDYAKGNRFFDLDGLGRMPSGRLFGNAVLSFVTKLSSGYWDVFDPTNGYTAIDARVLRRLPLDKVSRRYFFESDLLFRLNILRAVVVDVPMQARYGDEVSSLDVRVAAFEFLFRNVRNFGKRIFYNYYLRDLSIASIELPAGLLMLVAGTTIGAQSWMHSLATQHPAPTGTVMLSALLLLMGMQLLLAFVNYDIASVPRRPIGRLRRFRGAGAPGGRES
jgi:glycosyltransferase involved in cell wall biosynthesis